MAVALLLTGCSAPAPHTPAPPAPTDRTDGAQHALTLWVTAARAGDRAGYDRVISDRDPGFAATASRWFATISGTPWTGLSLTVLPERTELSAARRALLGPDAWGQGVRVRWRLPGTDGTAEQHIWLAFVPDGDEVRIAGQADAPAGRPAAAVPIWLLEPVAVRHRGDLTVLVADPSTAATWLDRSTHAVAAVRRFLTAPSRFWSGRLVVQVPATRTDFERVLGVPAGSYGRIAAAAWSMGSDPATAPVQIVVNPELAARVGTAGLRVLLAHETVHVATHSVDSPAPTWLVEGYADEVAYTAYPDTRRAAAEPLLRRVADDGPPKALPADRDFDPDADDLDAAYAQAWLACRYIAERWGSDRLGRLYVAVDGGRLVTQAVPATLGVSEDALVAGWRGYLRRLAADPSW